MPRKSKSYDYWCIARTGGAFAIVDFKNMCWCYMYRNDVKANKSKIKFSEKKETFMRQFFARQVNGQFISPSIYFYKDFNPRNNDGCYWRGFQLRNSITNRFEDLWAVPYDIFTEACGEDPDMTSLLVLYGAEVLYDKILFTFMQNYYISSWGNWQPLV